MTREPAARKIGKNIDLFRITVPAGATPQERVANLYRILADFCTQTGALGANEAAQDQAEGGS